MAISHVSINCSGHILFSKFQYPQFTYDFLESSNPGKCSRLPYRSCARTRRFLVDHFLSMFRKSALGGELITFPCGIQWFEQKKTRVSTRRSLLEFNRSNSMVDDYCRHSLRTTDGSNMHKTGDEFKESRGVEPDRALSKTQRKRKQHDAHKH